MSVFTYTASSSNTWKFTAASSNTWKFTASSSNTWKYTVSAVDDAYLLTKPGGFILTTKSGDKLKRK